MRRMRLASRRMLGKYTKWRNGLDRDGSKERERQDDAMGGMADAFQGVRIRERDFFIYILALGLFFFFLDSDKGISVCKG